MMKIVIDPAAGGTQLGHQSFHQYANIVEKDYVLSLSLLQEELLKEHGYEVTLTRTQDVFVDLASRIAQTANQELLISNRINVGKKKGIEIYYAKHNGEKFAKQLKKAFENKGYVVRTCRILSEDMKDNNTLMFNSLAQNNILVYYGYVDGVDYHTLMVGKYDFAQSLLEAVLATYKTAN